MSGIRISLLPRGCTEKDIKAHFANPNNGGGEVKAIYYPLFKGHAVVIFEDEITAQTTQAHEHRLLDEDIFIEILPCIQVFTTLDATLDPTVAAFLQTDEDVRDEIQYTGGVEFCYNDDKHLIGVRGNWYALEWFWAHIQKIMDQQKFVPRVSNYRYSAYDFPAPARRTASPVTTEARSISGTNITPLISMPMPKGGSIIQTKVPSRDTWREPESPTGLDDENARNSIRLLNRDRLAGPVSDSDSSDGDNSDSEIQAPLTDKSAEDTTNNLSKLSVSGGQPSSNKIVIIHDNPNDPRTLDFKYGPLTVSIYTGYITMAETDAIVNAAMGPLINAGGVAGAIANAADPDMQRQCDEYVKKHGSVPTAGVMHTCAGGKISSSVKYVIHTVGPMWSSVFEDKCRMELTMSFLNSMKYGNDVLKISSITMPVISSGIFGCPLEMCVRSFFNAVLLFSSDHAGDSVTLRELHLINNNSDSTVMTVLQLRGLIGQDPESLVAEAKHEITQNVKDRGSGSASRLSTERAQRLTPDAVSSTRYDTDIQSPYLRSRQFSDSGISSTPVSPPRISDYTDTKFKSSPGTNPSKSGMRNLAYPASVSSTGLIHRSASGGNMPYSPANYRDDLDRDYYRPSASGHHSLDNPRLDTPTNPLISDNTGKARSPGPPTIGLQSVSMGLSPGGDIRGTISPVSPVASAYQPSHLYLSSGLSGDVYIYDDRAYGLDKNISAREPRTLDRPLPPVPTTAKWK